MLFLCGITVKKLRIRYLQAIRQWHFAERFNNSFIIWKICIKQLDCLPEYKTWQWFVFYSRKNKNVLKKKGFLVGLYYILLLLRPNFFKGYWLFHEKLNGWQFAINDNLLKHDFLFNFNYKFLQEAYNVPLTRFSLLWRLFRPFHQVCLHRIKLDIDLYRKNKQDVLLPMAFANYLLNEEKKYVFQYRILIGLQNLNRASMISQWFVKVLLLRMLKYPVVYRYAYLFVLVSLLNYESITLPWFRLLEANEIEFNQPASDVVHLIFLADELIQSYQEGEITEYLIKRHWESLLTESLLLDKQTLFCIELRAVLLAQFSIIRRMLFRLFIV